MPHPDYYSERLDEATAMALASFRQIERKGSGVPYITHLFGVCAIVGEYGGDEDQMIAALLHDWLEDIEGARADELERRFGARVARLVEGLSDAVAPTAGELKPPWRARKESYLHHLRDATPDLKLISAADKLHNCQSIVRDHTRLGNAVFERFSGRREGTLWYYDAVHAALGAGWSHPLVERLGQEVARLHEVAHA